MDKHKTVWEREKDGGREGGRHGQAAGRSNLFTVPVFVKRGLSLWNSLQACTWLCQLRPKCKRAHTQTHTLWHAFTQWYAHLPTHMLWEWVKERTWQNYAEIQCLIVWGIIIKGKKEMTSCYQIILSNSKLLCWWYTTFVFGFFFCLYGVKSTHCTVLHLCQYIVFGSLMHH